MKKVLVLNFGSTSTKLALYAEDRQILHKEFHHSSDEMGTPFTLKEIAVARCFTPSTPGPSPGATPGSAACATTGLG